MPVIPFSEQIATHISMLRSQARKEFTQAQVRFDTTMELCSDMEDRLQQRVAREEAKDAELAAMAGTACEAFAKAAGIVNSGGAPHQ